MGKALRRACAAVAATLLVFAAVVPVAAADYKTGRYEGTTSQGYEISFKAKERGVKKFHLTVELDCADGSIEGFLLTGAKAPTNTKGKFTASFGGEGSSVVKGKLRRKRAEGTIESEGMNEAGVPCSSTVEWSAQKT